MSRLHFTCLLAPCEKNFFCGKNCKNSSSFSDMEWKFSVFCQNFSRQVCQSYILIVHRNILGKNSFFLILMFSDQLRTLSKNLLAFCGKNLGSFVKKSLYLSIGTLWKELFVAKQYILSSSFLDMEWNFFVFCQNFHGRVVKAAYYLSTGNLWGEDLLEIFFEVFLSCSDFEQLFFFFLSIIFTWFWLSCKLSVQNNLRTKNVWRSSLVSHCFWTLSA